VGCDEADIRHGVGKERKRLFIQAETHKVVIGFSGLSAEAEVEETIIFPD
jgi:hypothetical protein